MVGVLYGIARGRSSLIFYNRTSDKSLHFRDLMAEGIGLRGISETGLAKKKTGGFGQCGR